MSLGKEPKGSRVERKKEETKKKIIMVAMKLIKEQGIDETTMEQIAREVDIAKGTLYNYFPAKEAIIDEYIKRSFRERNKERMLLLEKLPDTRSRMLHIFSELMVGVQANKDFFERYIVYRLQSTLSFHIDESQKSGLYLITSKIIELGQKSGEIRDDLPPYVLEDLFEYAFMEVVKRFYLEPDKFDPPRVIEESIDIFLRGGGK